MKALIILGFSFCCVGEILGCSCNYPGIDVSTSLAFLKYSFCHGDFAIRAWVKTDQRIPKDAPSYPVGGTYQGPVFHKIKIKEVFRPFCDVRRYSTKELLLLLRNKFNLKKKHLKKVYTKSNSALCGVDLQKTTKDMQKEEKKGGHKAGYLLIGHVDTATKELRINNCDYNREFKSLTSEEVAWLVNPDCTPYHVFHTW